MTTYRLRWRPMRVLDFDTENRPLTYAGDDFTFSEITAVAWSWGSKVECVLLKPGQEGIDLSRFREAYDQADLLTCHNLRKHDLPGLNGRLLEQGLPPLGPKLVQDTYLDLKRRRGVSGSQESLSEMLGVESPKVSMSQAKWRLANRLLPEGLVKTRERVVGDVLQHMQLRQELLNRGWLKPPRVWNP